MQLPRRSERNKASQLRMHPYSSNSTFTQDDAPLLTASGAWNSEKELILLRTYAKQYPPARVRSERSKAWKVIIANINSTSPNSAPLKYHAVFSRLRQLKRTFEMYLIGNIPSGKSTKSLYSRRMEKAAFAVWQLDQIYQVDPEKVRKQLEIQEGKRRAQQKERGTKTTSRDKGLCQHQASTVLSSSDIQSMLGKINDKLDMIIGIMEESQDLFQQESSI